MVDDVGGHAAQGTTAYMSLPCCRHGGVWSAAALPT